MGVSNWRLARAVSRLGQLGVVSGTALDAVIARRLQLGDRDGSIRRALSHFPWPDMAQRVLDKYFIPGGKPDRKPFAAVAKHTLKLKRESVELLIVSNFVEVFLARSGHDGPVGINYLEKIQLPTLPSLMGAMLAGVAFVIMGGGIPLTIPGIMSRLSNFEPVELKLDVEGNTHKQAYVQQFTPRDYLSGAPENIPRPHFLAIVSSDILAKTFTRRATGSVDGFIIENHTAGGHNAPPRRADSPAGQTGPQFGPRDIPDVEKIRQLGVPFWLAGGFGSPAKLKAAQQAGARGIQVGTAFAYCNESGMLPEIRSAVLDSYKKGTLNVLTDFRASPTGYPFKLISMKSPIQSMDTDLDRTRICDLGYLRQLYCQADGRVGYRCPCEPQRYFLAKGGGEDKMPERQCLCNGLFATIGLGQIRDTGAELPLITSGLDFSFVPHLVTNGSSCYSAEDVIAYLKS